MPDDLPIRRSARLDSSGAYRYRLTRRWNAGGPRLAFILLNPSTADAKRDDPTIQRCMGFARAWGFGSMEVVNLFAFRATRLPRLRRAADPVGPENDRWIRRATRGAARVVAAWGNHGRLRGRAAAVLEMLRGEGREVSLYCLGLTRLGEPQHPLYVPSGGNAVPYRGARGAGFNQPCAVPERKHAGC